MTMDQRLHAPSVARNRQPILDIIRPSLAAGGTVLEIAAGSGEHAVYLAPELQAKTWQPSDLGPEALASIEAWRQHTDLTHTIHSPLPLDMTAAPAEVLSILKQAEAPTSYDLITCINMIHISPWEACQGLMKHAANLLKPAGLLFLYGPYIETARATAASNLAFDESLKERNPSWGVRKLEDVIELAQAQGLTFLDAHPMPANNLSVFFSR
ncbi:MAG: DUF938 domain-containing protein [Pseudohongiella nitratireducens]|nr:DUF938 domain-containing protein [Pseudohongiella nitratireducens]